MIFEYESVGTLRASFSEGLYRIALDVDPGIVEVARALIPKYVRLNLPRYAPHISVIREASLPDGWQACDGRVVPFTYSPHVWSGEVYWWLQAESPDLRELRANFGLPPMDWYTYPPDFADTFHVTLGNCKGL